MLYYYIYICMYVLKDDEEGEPSTNKNGVNIFNNNENFNFFLIISVVFKLKEVLWKYHFMEILYIYI